MICRVVWIFWVIGEALGMIYNTNTYTTCIHTDIPAFLGKYANWEYNFEKFLGFYLKVLFKS